MRIRALCVLFVAACGGGSGNSLSTDPISAAEAQPICEANCQYEIDCGDNSEDLAACTASCIDEMVGWARGDAVETLFDCFTGLACDASTSVCESVVEPLQIHRDFEAECLTAMPACFSEPGELQETCQVTASPDGGGDAGFWRFIAPAIMEEFIACFDEGECAATLDCWTVIVETHGIDF